MIHDETRSTTQFIVQLSTIDLEKILRKVVADALRDNPFRSPSTHEPDEPLLSIAELCNKLQVSRDLVYRLRQKGKLPEYQLGRRKFFKLSEVLTALKTSRHDARKAAGLSISL